MTDTQTQPGKRYFDLKADVNRAEINVQEIDRALVVTGPIAVDESDGSTIYALESSPAIKEITLGEYSKQDPAKLTVAQLDERYGDVDGYPSDGNKDAKVAFAKTQGGTD